MCECVSSLAILALALLLELFFKVKGLARGFFWIFLRLLFVICCCYVSSSLAFVSLLWEPFEGFKTFRSSLSLSTSIYRSLANVSAALRALLASK